MSQNEGVSFSFKKALKEVFPFFNENDDQQAGYVYESGAGHVGSHFKTKEQVQEESGSSITKAGKRLHLHEISTDRFLLYDLYKEMADDSTIDAAIQLHLGHALSTSSKDNQAVFLVPKSEEHAEYVAQLNRELMKTINDNLLNWAYICAIYGVSYIRPYVQQGKGITHFEFNFYTLPNQIREYERSGVLCGFTSENLKERINGQQVRLAEPWALVPMKIPVWRPNMKIEPINYSGKKYSLYDDAYSRSPIETQNYGTSMLHTSIESWLLLRQSIAALGASRVNSSLIDRLVSVNTDGLDVAGAAEYINLLADQMQADRKVIVENSRKQGFIPTVINTILPLMGGTKGGVNVDTFTTEPNITAIEDILFHAKRLGASLGADISMLGFGDLLAGGLGEGGFFRTSIQTALRANQLRSAVATTVRRMIDIHTVFRDGKYWADGDEPFEIKFNSLNTAIAQEEGAAALDSVNYATLIATVLDLIEQSPIGKSEKLKNHVYTSILGLDPELSKEVIKELAGAAAEAVTQDKAMMESIGMTNHDDVERFVKDTVLELINNLS